MPLLPASLHVAAVLGLGLAAAPWPMDGQPRPSNLAMSQRKEAFGPLLRRLEEARVASVSSVCGSGVAPWTYRGRSGKNTTLRAYVTDKADEPWTREFVRTLMREADWDSSLKHSASIKPCDEVHEVPLYLVELRARGRVYALLDFEKRCAQLFEPNRPLGEVRFADRADSLFALVRRAIPSDSLTRALTSPPARPDSSLAGRPIGYTTALVEHLPEPVHKTHPSYPDAAREANVQGTVWVQALVDREGTVFDAFVLNSIPELDDAALDAVWHWKFKPAVTGGKPIAVWVAIPVRFSIH
ncbi:MAG TPA: energy transducer TonB [Candidatus Limnocylindria bacterium]|nr:energy transducer TonB [Candidatus Limnocylindria bacterium]